MCRTDGKGPCNRESVTYEIKCTGCNNVNVGEKLRSAYTRGKEHSKSLGNKEERSALWKHCREKHSSEIQQFQMNVKGVKINNVDEDSLMNSKNEWNYFQIPHAVVTDGRVVLPR